MTCEENRKEIEFHPASEIFPLMDSTQIEALAANIRSDGLLEPIVRHPDGRILDGRNRYRSCLAAGVEPRFETWKDDGEPYKYVWSANAARRHLNSSQKAVIALEILPFLEKEARKRQAHGMTGPGRKHKEIFPEASTGQARNHAAALVGTNPRYISDVKAIRDEAPDLLEEIRSGPKSISQAKRELRRRRTVERERNAARSGKASRHWSLTSDPRVIQCDVLITDPPYGLLDETWEPQSLKAFTQDWAGRWASCGADLIVIFWSQEYLFPGQNWFDGSLADHYKLQHLLIWVYRNNVKPHGLLGFKRSWEPIFVYRRLDSGKRISISGVQWGKEQHNLDCHIAAVPQSNYGGENLKQHPAQKPVGVLRWLVGLTTRPGEFVVDPFCGSGTTGIAATQLGRRFLGIETNTDYLELAGRRIAAYGGANQASRANGREIEGE